MDMDQVLEFIKGLNVFQWVLLAGGACLLWSTVRTFFKSEAPDEDIDDGHNHDLTALVNKWECLCDCCHDHGLDDACAKLQEVFPMLIKPYEKNNGPETDSH